MTEKPSKKPKNEIDQAAYDSFPASDPPSWSGAAAHPEKQKDIEEKTKLEKEHQDRCDKSAT